MGVSPSQSPKIVLTRLLISIPPNYSKNLFWDNSYFSKHKQFPKAQAQLLLPRTLFCTASDVGTQLLLT